LDARLPQRNICHIDWIADDEQLERAHKATLLQADVALLGKGSYPGMSSFWTAAEQDEKASVYVRDVARAINEIPKIVYSHQDMQVSSRNTSVHVVEDDNALVEDVQRLKRETEGTLLLYGDVRLAQTFVQRDLLDEIHLDICPVILGAGKPLFTDLTHRTNLRLLQATSYASGVTTMSYEVAQTS
jgi:dihydrofolate reductase